MCKTWWLLSFYVFLLHTSYALCMIALKLENISALQPCRCVPCPALLAVGSTVRKAGPWVRGRPLPSPQHHPATSHPFHLSSAFLLYYLAGSSEISKVCECWCHAGMGAPVVTILSSFRVRSLLSLWLAVAVFTYFVFALPQLSGLYSISNIAP